MLKLDRIIKAWPDFRLELDLALSRGEVAALLGPSGSGKSTLLRIIAGLEPSDSGRVLVAGRDVSSLPPERRGIGMVFQDYALFPHLSVRRNIEYGPKMRGAGRAARRDLAARIAASFEIEALLDRSPHTLSGGEQQRAALARALAAAPDILLLDEPLSSLDAALRLRLRAEIAGRLKAEGMTALFVTHDSREAFAVADRIFLLRSGSIEASGSPEEVYAAPPTAWSASFLGRGPVLEVSSFFEERGALVARTAIGDFECRNPSGPEPSSRNRSLFFPAEAARPVEPSPARSANGPDVARNRLRGRVVSSVFEGGSRRVAVSCLVRGSWDGAAGSVPVELELPRHERPQPGDFLELEVPPELCLALPGAPGSGPQE